MRPTVLKELDTFKSQLFTNLTHEFRTPLTVILGMTNQLATGKWQSTLEVKEKGRISNASAIDWKQWKKFTPTH
jgi:signal transduction histidine kinase